MTTALTAFSRNDGNAAPSSLDERYGALKPHLNLVNSQIERLISHRSVRKYSATPVHEDVLRTLVAAAQSAATSSNLQLFSVVSVDDPERRKALCEAAGGQAHVLQAPLFLVWLADLRRVSRLAELRATSQDAVPYLESFLTAVIDTALAAQNAVVAAESLGLGTVYIGAVRNKPERVAEILALPENTFAVFGLCVGWPDPAVPTAIKPRLPQDIVLHRNVYQKVDDHLPLVEQYDAEVAKYQAAQRTGAQVPWSAQATTRISTVEALGGRHKLRDHLHALGFELR